MLIVEPPVGLDRGGRHRVEAGLTGAAADSLWFDLPTPFADMVSTRSDAFAVALVLPAMRLGVDLHVGGVVTDELLYRINHEYQHLHRGVFPQYRPIRVTSDETAPAEAGGGGVAAGFSCGVDSYALLHDYVLDEECPPPLRVTHWLFNDVGSHGEGRSDALFDRRLRGVRDAVAPFGMPVIDVDSNLDESFGLGRGYGHTAFLQTHTVRNASVAHLLAPGLRTWLYASSVEYDHMHAGPGHSSSPSEAIALQLLSHSQLQLRSVGGEHTRVDKTRIMAGVPDAEHHLDVCVRERSEAASTNCSSCFKCLRTIYTLDVLGLANPFFAAGTFDRDVYLAAKRDYEVSLLVPGNAPLEREVLRLSREAGRTFDLAQQARAVTKGIRPAAARVWHAAHRGHSPG